MSTDIMPCALTSCHDDPSCRMGNKAVRHQRLENATTRLARASKGLRHAIFMQAAAYVEVFVGASACGCNVEDYVDASDFEDI